jgi:hypothetical protein
MIGYQFLYSFQCNPLKNWNKTPNIKHDHFYVENLTFQILILCIANDVIHDDKYMYYIPIANWNFQFQKWIQVFNTNKYNNELYTTEFSSKRYQGSWDFNFYETIQIKSYGSKEKNVCEILPAFFEILVNVQWQVLLKYQG